MKKLFRGKILIIEIDDLRLESREKDTDWTYTDIMSSIDKSHPTHKSREAVMKASYIFGYNSRLDTIQVMKFRRPVKFL